MAIVNVYFDNIKREILHLLDEAKESIQICMAWLTDSDLMNKLIEKIDMGVDIRICLLDHEFNRSKFPTDYGSQLENLNNYLADLTTFQKKNGKLHIVPSNLGFLHHKFVVIDKTISITGSYNWSINASRNKENIVVIHDAEIASKFLEQIEQIIDIHNEYTISSKFDSCANTQCDGNIIKIKIIDARENTKFGQNETYLVNICSKSNEHISIARKWDETDTINDLIQDEMDMINAQYGYNSLPNVLSANRQIESKIAKSLDSRLDYFIENESHKILGAYKIVVDIDGYHELKKIWEHPLIEHFNITFLEDQLIDIINDY